MPGFPPELLELAEIYEYLNGYECRVVASLKAVVESAALYWTLCRRVSNEFPAGSGTRNWQAVYSEEIFGRYCDQCSAPSCKESDQLASVFLCDDCTEAWVLNYADADDIAKDLEWARRLLSPDGSPLERALRAGDSMRSFCGSGIATETLAKLQRLRKSLCAEVLDKRGVNLRTAVESVCGKAFAQHVFYVIIPPTAYLENERSTRLVCPFKKRKFEGVDLSEVKIARRPFCTIELGLAGAIEKSFVSWSTSSDPAVVLESQTALVNVAAKASLCFVHPNRATAENAVQKYVESRQIDHEALIVEYIARLYRVLYRQSTSLRRPFFGTQEDCLRVTRFFAGVVRRTAPAVRLRGYSGVRSIPD